MNLLKSNTLGRISFSLRVCVCVCGKCLRSCLVQSRPLVRAANKADQRISELQVLIEELQWDMEKIRRRENRLNAHLIEILERVSARSSP